MPSMRDFFKKPSRPPHIQNEVERSLAQIIQAASKIDQSPLSAEDKAHVLRILNLKPHFLLLGTGWEYISWRDIRAARKAAASSPLSLRP